MLPAESLKRTGNEHCQCSLSCVCPSRDTWKRNPASKHVFSWTLLHVSRPWLCPHLERVLPPALLLSDDFQEENKVLGVRCLHHIVLNVVREAGQGLEPFPGVAEGRVGHRMS